MGNKYNNLTVRGAERDDIIRLLNEKGYPAFISPSVNGFTVVWPDYWNPTLWSKERAEAERQLNACSHDIPKELACLVLEVGNFDDDILSYRLMDKGVVLDFYQSISSTDYFGEAIDDEGAPPEEEPQSVGDAALLCNTFGVPQHTEEVHDLLHNQGITFELDRHRQWVELLFLLSYAVGFDFRYLQHGALPEGLTAEQLTRTGPNS